MSLSQQLDLVNSWPLTKRLAILTLSIIDSTAGAAAPVRNLIAVATTMAAQLNSEQRAIIAAFMRSEADLLDAPRWN
jgi:hypothetical protein